MRAEKLFLLFFLLPLFLSKVVTSQNSPTEHKHTVVSKIGDIPHKTIQEKLLWPHRVFVYNVTKDKKLKYDTNYIQSYRRSFTITLPLSYRFLRFSLIDPVTNNKLVFTPNSQLNLGISISSQWASFIVNSGIKVFQGDKDKKGETSFRDVQLNIYGRKFTTDAFVQYYQGFYIKNSSSYPQYLSDKPYHIEKDAYALNFGISTYYITNNKRFSYKNSFAFSERQKKSAGSLLVGIYYSYFDVTGNPTLIADVFRNSFDSSSYIKSGHAHNFGLNLGYIYTFVFLKKWYTTASLTQGIGGAQTVYLHENNSIENQLSGGAGKINARLALGYDAGKLFVGAMGMIDYYLIKGKTTTTFDYSFGKAILFVGYRFTVRKTERKILRRLKLIDY